LEAAAAIAVRAASTLLLCLRFGDAAMIGAFLMHTSRSRRIRSIRKRKGGGSEGGADRLPVVLGPEDTAVLSFERSRRRERVAAEAALAYDPPTAKCVRAPIEEPLGAGVAV